MKNIKEYLSAQHAMQTGVAIDQEKGCQDGTPKSLRVGINSAMCNHAGLVQLLIKKGVLTKEEYVESITEEMNKEVERYEIKIGRDYGIKVTLA